MHSTTIFGHRGIPAKEAENSLAGFRYALAHQVEGLECDVHLTRDRVPVIIHDETIDRTTNGHGKVIDYSLVELQTFQLANGEPIPTLALLLDLIGDAPLTLNLEFKTDVQDYPGIEELVLATVRRSRLARPVIFSSFNLATIINAHRLDPGFNYCFLTDQAVPDADGFAAQNHLAGLHLEHYQEGVEVPQRIWTVNDPTRLRKLFNKRVAGVFTDDFELARELRG